MQRIQPSGVTGCRCSKKWMTSLTHSRTFRRLWYKEGRAWNGTHADLLLPEQRRGWSLLISCARATRGLRRPSLDARNGRSISPHPCIDTERAWKDHLSPRSTAAMRPARVPFLGRDRRGNNIRAVRYGAVHGYSVSFPTIIRRSTSGEESPSVHHRRVSRHDHSLQRDRVGWVMGQWD